MRCGERPSNIASVLREIKGWLEEQQIRAQDVDAGSPGSVRLGDDNVNQRRCQVAVFEIRMGW